tara:strand:+ start:33 stop:500 length:468 start_codon:yes stop_codon:yes gene_type:complete
MKYYLTEAGVKFLEEATVKQKLVAGVLAGGMTLGGISFLNKGGSRPPLIRRTSQTQQKAPTNPNTLVSPTSNRRQNIQPNIPSTRGEKPRDPNAPKPTPMQYRAGAGGKKKSEFIKWHVGQNRGNHPEGTQGDIMAQKDARLAYDKANLIPAKDK